MSRRRLVALLLVWTLPSAVFLAATALVFGAFRIAPPDRLDGDDRRAAMAPLRAALDDTAVAPCTLHRPLADGGPVVVTVWIAGHGILRVDGYGTDLATAIDAAARDLHAAAARRNLAPGDRGRARIQLDILTGRGPLGGGEWLFDNAAIPGIGSMLAINSGVEGVGTQLGDKAVLLLPHELVAAKVLAAKRPSDQLPDFAMGVDLASIDRLLSARAGTPATAAHVLFRFRTDTFVEPPRDRRGEAPLPLTRGVPPPPTLTAAHLRAAALAGGHYLVAHLAPSGRYIYEHDLSNGVQTDPSKNGAYSLPRHAGSTYFLAELYRITHEPWLREPIERAFAHLATLIEAGHCGGTTPAGVAFDCVLDRGETTAQLGSTALTVVALAEYQRATGDARYLPLARLLSAWLLYMQRPDGSFRHLYDPKTQTPDETAQLFYYSGEAALALARMYAVTSEPAYAAATERALDWLVGWYDFFMGGFFYGEEHWTCIAAEAIWPAVRKDSYRDFCAGYGAFLRQQQPEVGDHPDEDDLAGAYNVTPFVTPYNTPAGSRTEAMISAYLLTEHHGDPDPELRAQVAAALAYVLGQQVRPDSDFDAVGIGDGGIPATPIDRTVRIDYVQHVCSAMIRASEWIDTPPATTP